MSINVAQLMHAKSVQCAPPPIRWMEEEVARKRILQGTVRSEVMDLAWKERGSSLIQAWSTVTQDCQDNAGALMRLAEVFGQWQRSFLEVPKEGVDASSLWHLAGLYGGPAIGTLSLMIALATRSEQQEVMGPLGSIAKFLKGFEASMKGDLQGLEELLKKQDEFGYERFCTLRKDLGSLQLALQEEIRSAFGKADQKRSQDAIEQVLQQQELVLGQFKQGKSFVNYQLWKDSASQANDQSLWLPFFIKRLENLADQMSEEGYNGQRLYRERAVHPACFEQKAWALPGYLGECVGVKGSLLPFKAFFFLWGTYVDLHEKLSSDERKLLKGLEQRLSTYAKSYIELQEKSAKLLEEAVSSQERLHKAIRVDHQRAVFERMQQLSRIEPLCDEESKSLETGFSKSFYKSSMVSELKDFHNNLSPRFTSRSYLEGASLAGNIRMIIEPNSPFTVTKDLTLLGGRVSFEGMALAKDLVPEPLHDIAGPVVALPGLAWMGVFGSLMLVTGFTCALIDKVFDTSTLDGGMSEEELRELKARAQSLSDKVDALCTDAEKVLGRQFSLADWQNRATIVNRADFKRDQIPKPYVEFNFRYGKLQETHFTNVYLEELSVPIKNIQGWRGTDPYEYNRHARAGEYTKVIVAGELVTIVLPKDCPFQAEDFNQVPPLLSEDADTFSKDLIQYFSNQALEDSKILARLSQSHVVRVLGVAGSPLPQIILPKSTLDYLEEALPPLFIKSGQRLHADLFRYSFTKISNDVYTLNLLAEDFEFRIADVWARSIDALGEQKTGVSVWLYGDIHGLSLPGEKSFTRKKGGIVPVFESFKGLFNMLAQYPGFRIRQIPGKKALKPILGRRLMDPSAPQGLVSDPNAEYKKRLRESEEYTSYVENYHHFRQALHFLSGSSDSDRLGLVPPRAWSELAETLVSLPNVPEKSGLPPAQGLELKVVQATLCRFK